MIVMKDRATVEERAAMEHMTGNATDEARGNATDEARGNASTEARGDGTCPTSAHDDSAHDDRAHGDGTHDDGMRPTSAQATTRSNAMKLSLIIPCYNEQEALPLFYEETTSVLAQMACDYELLFVDDGSRDSTLAKLKEFAQADSHVRYLSFSRNFGKEAAMYAGFCNAGGDYVAVIDADMQDPPSLLPQMMEILLTGEYDSVATRRVSRAGEPPVRSWFSRRFYRLINRISDANIMDGARDFRLMRREMVQAIVEMGERNRFSKGIFGWIGFKTYWLPYENVERVAGSTKWSLWGLFKYAIDGIVNFSEAPLSIASWSGMFLTLMSFLSLIFIVVRRLCFGDPVAGWASTICVILFMGGVQLFCMGVMGQYIAKTYSETKRRPHFIVADTNMDDAMRVR